MDYAAECRCHDAALYESYAIYVTRDTIAEWAEAMEGQAYKTRHVQ